MSLIRGIYKHLTRRPFYSLAINRTHHNNDVVYNSDESTEDSVMYTSPAYAHLPENIFHETLYLSQQNKGNQSDFDWLD